MLQEFVSYSSEGCNVLLWSINQRNSYAPTYLRWPDRLVGGRVTGWTDGWMNETDGWMDGWMDETDRWMDETDRWMDG